MVQGYYKTDLGLVVKDDVSIRLKSAYKKTIITDEDFSNSNPIMIKKGKYLEELNKFFKNDKYKWEYDGIKYKKLDNFEMGKLKYSVENYDLSKDIPIHDIGVSYVSGCMIVLYHGKLYYTFISGNYFPQMQLIDFHSKELVKWTNIKNLAPVFNKKDKKII